MLYNINFLRLCKMIIRDQAIVDKSDDSLTLTHYNESITYLRSLEPKESLVSHYRGRLTFPKKRTAED